MSEAYDNMRKQRDALHQLCQEQHQIIEEIAVAFEYGRVSLTPNFLAKHIAILRNRAQLLALDVRNQCDDTASCPNCSMECSYARYVEEMGEFEQQRKEIMEGA